MEKPALAEVKPMTNARNGKETLQRIIDEHGDDLEYVVILAMHKDKARSIFTSMASHEEKSFLKCYWDWWVGNWFSGE